MSGFEAAGIVLGAFPLAISALEKYREVATRLGLFYKIKLAYRKCSNELEFHQLTITRHLKQLLLPLVDDDNKIRELIENPGGPAWKDVIIADRLEERLKDSYDLYLQYISGLEQIMANLNHELAIDSQSVQNKLDDAAKLSSDISRVKSALSKDSRIFQLYRVKFSNSETVRKKLFAELEDYSDKLESLLESSDKESELIQKRTLAKQTKSIDTAICNFWIQASKLFKALASAWNCRCNNPHHAKLLLQHQSSKTPEFELLFIRSLSSNWEMKRTRLAQNDNTIPLSVKEAMPLTVQLRQPNHRVNQPLRSAMKGKGTATAQLLKPIPSITLSPVNKHFNAHQPIFDLCGALDHAPGACCGYLSLADEDFRYYVYTMSSCQEDSVPSISLDQIIKGEIFPPPTRKQRYTISLILASSFLQMTGTPWLPSSFKAADISFYSDQKDPNIFLLDKPHISHELASMKTPYVEATSLSQSLDQLGILLLELCFGKTLADQPFRKEWPGGESEKERMVFDIMAAREWQRYVIEEAGQDYSDAVSWCLGGNRSTSIEIWRQEMLRKAVLPLQRSLGYLLGSLV